MSKISIYAIYEKSSGSVKYVGQTKNYEGRRNYHFSPNKKSGHSVYDKMVSELGPNNYEMKELEVVSQEDASNREDYYINKFTVMGNRLWNNETNRVTESGLPKKSDRLNTASSRYKRDSVMMDKYGNLFGDHKKSQEAAIAKYSKLMSWTHTEEAEQRRLSTNNKIYGYSWGAAMLPTSRILAVRKRHITYGHVYLIEESPLLWGLGDLYSYVHNYLGYTKITYGQLKNIHKYGDKNYGLPNNLVDSIHNNKYALKLAPLMINSHLPTDDDLYANGVNQSGLKVYSANPWFTEEQMERSEYIRTTLLKLGFNVYDPKSEGLVKPSSSVDWRKEVFNHNVKAIEQADFILAVTDGKDMGVCFETGYAYGCGTPIVYFAETLGHNKFNLMLAQSGIAVLTSRDELEATLQDNNFIDSILNNIVYKEYTGNIE